MLDKNLQGRLTWNVGHPSSINSSIVWDNQSHRLVCAIQVSLVSGDKAACFIFIGLRERVPQSDGRWIGKKF
jgi:hypothetical protein